MNAFQLYLSRLPAGHYITSQAQIDELVRLHRLCACLVRCGCVRFACGAQYLTEMMAMVRASGDYIRDVSVCLTEVAQAQYWRQEAPMPIDYGNVAKGEL